MYNIILQHVPPRLRRKRAHRHQVEQSVTGHQYLLSRVDHWKQRPPRDFVHTAGKLSIFMYRIRIGQDTECSLSGQVFPVGSYGAVDFCRRSERDDVNVAIFATNDRHVVLRAVVGRRRVLPKSHVLHQTRSLRSLAKNIIDPDRTLSTASGVIATDARELALASGDIVAELVALVFVRGEVITGTRIIKTRQPEFQSLQGLTEIGNASLTKSVCGPSQEDLVGDLPFCRDHGIGDPKSED